MKGLKFVLHVTWTQCCEDWNRTVKGGNMNTGGEVINFFSGLGSYDVLFFRLIPNHLHLPYDCWVTPLLFVINTESPSLSVLLHLSIEQIKLRLTAYLSMFISS